MDYAERAAKDTKELDGDNYSKAVALVKESGRVSTSYVQRKLHLGYNRACRLIEAMEVDGIVSAPDCTGKRTVLGA